MNMNLTSINVLKCMLKFIAGPCDHRKYKIERMKHYLHLLPAIFLLFSLCLDAQTDVKIRRKDFKIGKEGFKEAWRNIKSGDSFYIEKGAGYKFALAYYTQSYTYNNSNPELNYKIGITCLFSDKKDEAAGFFLKALELKNNIAPDILLLAGHALKYSGKYSEALDKYNGYLISTVKKSAENSALAKKCIEECNSALLITRDTLRVEINNLGSNINSDADDYSEVFTPEGKTVYFASRRKLSPISGKDIINPKVDENIFVSTQKNGAWELAALAGKNLTTKYCEAPLFINKTGDRLYIYTGYEGDGDIKVSVNKKGKWRLPEPESFRINSKGTETSFCISPSGNEIFFVSNNRKGGFGGKDIYFVKKVNKRRWSRPENAGSAVNTAYDEESVRFSNNGDTMWFSSKGHNTIGGFDIFYSIKTQAGKWDPAVNKGYPVNTSWNELFYCPSPADDSTFYFASNRRSGFGGLDIYSGRILPPLPPPPPPVIFVEPVIPVKPDTIVIRDTIVIVKEITPVVQPEVPKELILFLVGKVTDSETDAPVIASVEILDLTNNVVIGTTASSDVDGSYRFKLPAKKAYMINFRGNGYLSDKKRIIFPESYSEESYNLEVALVKVKVGKKVVLNNILFEVGKAVLTTGSYSELDRLVSIMQDSPQMKIEISGHTDKTGSEPINFKLSEERAKTVVEYLVKKGIDRARMEYKGFGSLQPIDDNATPAGRAKNRRVEFKILEF
jgi:outer membrane protein OmpA-like peptidoglycan-associated protein